MPDNKIHALIIVKTRHEKCELWSRKFQKTINALLWKDRMFHFGSFRLDARETLDEQQDKRK